jgi:cytochrome c553
MTDLKWHIFRLIRRSIHLMRGIFFGTLVFYVTAYAQTGQEKSAMCAGCHGIRGISTNPDWPSLAGQHVNYLVKQLHDYKTAGTRQNAVMTAMAATLTDGDIQELADFYASLPPPEARKNTQDTRLGETLYRQGDLKQHITACIACHGPKGTGNAQAGFPVISRQSSAYIIQQLKAFKDQTRANDLNGIMRDICARMSDKDEEAVALYLEGLAP